MKSVVYFIRLSRPIFLLGAMLIYALGGGIALYTGVSIDWRAYLLGQLWALLLQLSVHYLNEFFNAEADTDNPNRTPFSGGSGVIGEGKLDRRTPFIAGIASLGFLASLSVLIIAQLQPEAVVYLIMLMSFVGALAYSVPPFSLESTGYGELVTSALVGFLLPAFAFALQAGEISPIILMTTLPLSVIHLAMMMAFEYPDYYSDLKSNKLTLLTRVGWQQGMTFHSYLLVAAYLILLVMPFFGLPWFVVLHGVFSLPLAAFQIWQIYRVRSGSKPNWFLFTFTAVSIFGTMCYFMTFAYWTQ